MPKIGRQLRWFGMGGQMARRPEDGRLMYVPTVKEVEEGLQLWKEFINALEKKYPRNNNQQGELRRLDNLAETAQRELEATTDFRGRCR